MDILDELEPLTSAEREARISELDLDADQLREVLAGLDTPAGSEAFLDVPPTLVRNAGAQRRRNSPRSFR
jgi:hypothetical protein